MSGQVTRTRILRAGLDLASAKGLCRITFGAVAGRASLSKGGVVAHFPHLGDLKRSILDVALDLWSRTCLGADTGVGGGLPSLIRYLNVWIGWTRKAGLPGSCPIAQAIVELSFLAGTCSRGCSCGGVCLAADPHCVDPRCDRQATLIAGYRRRPTGMGLTGIYLSRRASSHSLRDPDADRKAQFSVNRIVASIQATNEGAAHQRQRRR